MELDALRETVKQNRIEWRKHSLQRMFERDISRDNVINVLMYGDIIKEYPDDRPFPSVLFQKVVNKRHLHVVASYSKKEKFVYIITAYESSGNYLREGTDYER
jgi:hypothetical protein